MKDTLGVCPWGLYLVLDASPSPCACVWGERGGEEEGKERGEKNGSLSRGHENRSYKKYSIITSPK